MLILLTQASCWQSPTATEKEEEEEAPVEVAIAESEPPTETPSEPPEKPLEEPGEPLLSPDLSLDTDGDGFSDWFEENIAHYNPNIPNDRYVILLSNNEDSLAEYTRRTANFLIEKGRIPAENIILLLQEEATNPNLQKAIGEIAAKADKNDIVLISLGAHGNKDFICCYDIATPYASIDGWIDKIEAKVVIVRIIACESESALPALKDSPCPRILFIWYGEFMAAIGVMPKYNIEADTEYGNGDGYVSLKELSNWHENDWKFYSAMAEKSGKGIPTMLDESNIAPEIYLTDYTPSE